jgi:hypothetical protein
MDVSSMLLAVGSGCWLRLLDHAAVAGIDGISGADDGQE